MFALFFSLYLSMFMGSWINPATRDIGLYINTLINKLGEVLTSLFNGTTSPVLDLGTTLTSSYGGVPMYLSLVAFVLALITSIGIVVAAVKGIKKIFYVFFYMGR